jgi:hypothetical protein
VGTHHFDLSGILLRAVAGNAKQSSPRQPRVTNMLIPFPILVLTSASRIWPPSAHIHLSDAFLAGP